MTNINPFRSEVFDSIPGIEHGFFTRYGGVSEGGYSSLNVGLSSGDDHNKVLENRNRVSLYFNQPFRHLVMCEQVHGNDVVVVEKPWDLEHQPKADALITNQPNLVLGVQTADCCPILLSSGDGKVVAAVHAGWKSALSGVIRQAVMRMHDMGSHAIKAVIGPAIEQNSYEVDERLHYAFTSQNPESEKFFKKGVRDAHYLFDLKGYCHDQLLTLNIEAIVMPHDTYSDASNFFSCRRSAHQGEYTFGRQISCIMCR